MQVTEIEKRDSEEAYRLLGEAVLMLADAGLETTRIRLAGIFRSELDIPGKWSPGMADVLQIVIDKLEILPDVNNAEPLLKPGPISLRLSLVLKPMAVPLLLFTVPFEDKRRNATGLQPDAVPVIN
ncbi:DUF2767 family protein [Pantoea agglomerans]|uniref:DUF2767 family protein n=2 Tax=Erwiniaceae TaxID=1903409 RepID=UPI00100947A7|nr:DUF2767 family protein [Pantoea agglomerans]QAV47588.1 DUF2767 family protein [Pantoea agglomerans]QAV52208.1 DUF2767 family protein [Pantoea agglomerans]